MASNGFKRGNSCCMQAARAERPHNWHDSASQGVLTAVLTYSDTRIQGVTG